MTMRIPTTAILAVLAVFAGKVPAQDDSVDLNELARQIRRNMVLVEESLTELDAKTARMEGEHVVKNLEELIEESRAAGSKTAEELAELLEKATQAKRAGRQVVKDIQKLVENMERSSGGGGKSSGGRQKQKSGQPRARDRNQAQNRPPQDQGGRKERDGQQNPPGGRNVDDQPKQYPDPEKVKHPNIEDIWGVLPPELRQRLVNRSFRDFTPEYEREIKAYMRRIMEGR